MPKFELTAKYDMMHNGMVIYKGQTLEISVPQGGITKNNLFNNSRCAANVLHQFKMNEYDIAPNSPWLNAGKWDIKMK